MELTVYASGNGALSFCWQEKDHRTGQTIATGRTVTMPEARDYLKNRKRAEHLRNDGWKVWDSGLGGPVLVHPIKRIGPNKLLVHDKEMTYYHNQTDPFYIKDGDIRAVSLRVTHKLDEECGIEEEQETRHISTLAAIAHFLKYEKAMQARPPESVV